MSLAILFHFLCAQHVSDINISAIRSLWLFCWIITLVVLFLVRCVLEFRCGWVGVVSVLQASACNMDINLLTPNDHYSGHTTPLTSKRCILYIYSTNIGTEYFKHAIYSPFFPLQNAVCFINLSYLVLVLFTFYIQGVLKLKKNNSGAKRLMSKTCWAHRKWNKIASYIKLVFYSSTITMMHGPINKWCIPLFMNKKWR